jgi:DNA-binding ferritin-like protein
MDSNTNTKKSNTYKDFKPIRQTNTTRVRSRSVTPQSRASTPDTQNNRTKKIGGKRQYINRINQNKNKNKNILLESFQKEITVIFFELLLLIKLFHWNTHSYSTHKATDELYSSFNKNMDNFIEVLLGKTGKRIDLYNQKQIRLEYLTSNDKLKQRIDSFKSYLVSLDNKPAIKLMSNTDLLNIRDELLGDMNKFLYLLTLK